LSDAAFVWASKFIGGRDAKEVFLACSVSSLDAGVSFDQVSVGGTPVSKLMVPLPKFVAARKDDIKFLVRVELDAKVIVGSYTCLDHDASIAGLHNEGRLNRVFELARVAYGPHPVPSSDAFTEASKKRKIESVRKVLVKHRKAHEKKKVETAKTFTPQGKVSLKRPSDMEVASMKSAKVSKKTVPHAITAALFEAQKVQLAPQALKSLEAPQVLNLQLVQKSYRARKIMLCSRYLSYGGC
jgi:hypothetical protein